MAHLRHLLDVELSFRTCSISFAQHPDMSTASWFRLTCLPQQSRHHIATVSTNSEDHKHAKEDVAGILNSVLTGPFLCGMGNLTGRPLKCVPARHDLRRQSRRQGCRRRWDLSRRDPEAQHQGGHVGKLCGWHMPRLQDDAWMVLFGEVLDVTKFLPIHPGGDLAVKLLFRARGGKPPPRRGYHRHAARWQLRYVGLSAGPPKGGSQR